MMGNPCISCGSSDTFTIFDARRSLKSSVSAPVFSPTAHDFGIISPLRRCRACGVIFAPAAAEEGARGLYADSKDPLYVSQAPERCVTYRRVLFLLRRYLAQGAQMLDIGCSYGLLLKLARQEGMKVNGVELSRDAVKHCSDTEGLDVFCGEVEEAGFKAGYFDCVTALEVLEHLREPQRFIGTVREILKPGGILCLATPDTASLSAKMMGRRWWSYRQMHVCYFSKASITAFLSRNGFSIIAILPYRKTFRISYIVGCLLRRQQKDMRAAGTPLSGLLSFFDLPLTMSFGDMLVIARRD